MSAWPGKYVIGLTGNIATGKSVVRKMLEHLGAYGIDADALSHRAIAPDAPGYQAVVEAFGKWILGPGGEVERSKLGKVVFSDEEALRRLEAIVHPLVRQAVDHLVKKTSREVVVIEAIKLLESPLREACDSIWVTTASQEQQLARLAEKRGLDEATARERMAAQSPQDEKTAAADVVIENDGSFEETWGQVRAAWLETFPEEAEEAAPLRAAAPAEAAAGDEAQAEEFAVFRARPQQAGEIAAFITQHTGGKRKMRRADVMAAFGEKAYLLLKSGDEVIGLLGWQVENLVARSDEVYIQADVPLSAAMRFLIAEVEEASKELQAEAALVFVTPEIAEQADVWSGLGYEVRTPEALGVSIWEEAAHESMVEGAVMLFKRLRVDRVLRPI